MDGDAAFGVKTERLAAAAELSDRARISGFASIQHRDSEADPARELLSANPMASGLLRWIEYGAVILSTFAAAFGAGLFLTQRQAAELAAADLVAVLVFFLIARFR